MGTAKHDRVDLDSDQKNVAQHGMGVAGAHKPSQHKGHWRAQSLASLLGINPPLCSRSGGSRVGVTLRLELVSPSESRLTL